MEPSRQRLSLHANNLRSRRWKGICPLPLDSKQSTLQNFQIASLAMANGVVQDFLDLKRKTTGLDWDRLVAWKRCLEASIAGANSFGEQWQCCDIRSGVLIDGGGDNRRRRRREKSRNRFQGRGESATTNCSWKQDGERLRLEGEVARNMREKGCAVELYKLRWGQQWKGENTCIHSTRWHLSS